MASASKIFRSAFVIMAVLFLVKPVNVCKEILVAAFFGTTVQMDLFFASLVIPTLLVGALGGLFQATVVPVYNEVKSDPRQKDAWFSSLVTVFGAGLFALTVLLLFALKYLLPHFAPAYIAAHRQEFMLFSVLSFPTIFFFGMAALMRSCLEAVFDFKTSVVLQVSIAVVVIGSVVLGRGAGVLSLAAGNCAGTVVYGLLMWRAASRAGFRYSAGCDLRHGQVRKVFFLMAPLIVGTAFTHLNVAVDITMASFLPAGSISALSYAEKIMIAVRSFFIFSLSAVAMSYFAKDVADKRIDQLDLSIGHAVRFSAVFLVPLSIFCMVMAVPLVQVVFQRGMFTAESTLLTGRAFACFAAGLFPVALVFIVPRVFYALQENKIVLAVAAAGSAVNVLLNYLLMQCMGAAGIALSTSCVYVLSGGMLLYLLKRRLPQLDVRSYAKTVLPILVSSLAAAVSMMMVYGMQIFSVVAGNLALGALVFAGVYAAMLFVVSRKDMLLLLGSIQSMFKTEEPEAGIP